MKLEELCAAVQEARYYNERFTRREYTSAFRTYTERFGPLYMEAVRETADCIRVSSICALVIGKNIKNVGSFRHKNTSLPFV